MSKDYFETADNIYQTLEILGEGGSGRVFKVKDEDEDIFALKYLMPTEIKRDKVKVKRFKNELFFGLKNNHNNIVKVLDWGYKRLDGKKCPFYIMPFYPKTLRDLIKEGIAHEKVLIWFSQIMDGVESAHLTGIYHRDLKPENILFESDTETLLIADFGIAHFCEAYLETSVETNRQSRLANFQYAAPEQRTKGVHVDHRADIYALGLILNEMFTNEVPQGTGFKTIGAVNPDYSYLDDIVAMMIKQSPDDRPKDIDRIKIELAIHENSFIERQRLNKLNNTVIPKSNLDDPLVNDPIRIINRYYGQGKLIFQINHFTNEAWRNSFKDVDYSDYSFPNGPPFINIYSDRMVIEADESNPQSTVDFVKEVIKRTNKLYEEKMQKKMEEKETLERRELAKEIEETEKREKILKQIKI